MNIAFGIRGNEKVKFLATMKGIDPHDMQAVGEMLMPLIDAETAIVLGRVQAANRAVNPVEKEVAS